MFRYIAIVLAAFTIAVTAAQAAVPNETADLSVTLTDSPDPVRQGEPLTYHLTVTNHGPGTARNARALLIPDRDSGKLLSPLDTACQVVGSSFECALPELAPSASTSYQWSVSAQGVRQVSVMSHVLSDTDGNDYNDARGQVTRILYRIPTPDERARSPLKSSLDGRSCFISYFPDGTKKGEYLKPELIPMEAGGVYVVALPQGFQDKMTGTSPLHLGVLLTAIDQPGFPDWLLLKRAIFTQKEISGLSQGEIEHELLLTEDQEHCGNVLPSYFFGRYPIEKNEKLYCADPKQVRLFSGFPVAMHLWFEDRQGKTYEIEDEFCPFTAS